MDVKINLKNNLKNNLENKFQNFSVSTIAKVCLRSFEMFFLSFLKTVTGICLEPNIISAIV